MALSKSYILNDGISIPAVGLGTLEVHDKDVIISAIMQNGYKHLNTAEEYENEGVIGEALQECFKQGKKRDDVYLTSKIWHTSFGDVEGRLRQSL